MAGLMAWLRAATLQNSVLSDAGKGVQCPRRACAVGRVPPPGTSNRGLPEQPVAASGWAGRVVHAAKGCEGRAPGASLSEASPTESLARGRVPNGAAAVRPRPQQRRRAETRGASGAEWNAVSAVLSPATPGGGGSGQVDVQPGERGDGTARPSKGRPAGQSSAGAGSPRPLWASLLRVVFDVKSV